MYQVNREKISEILNFMNNTLEIIKPLTTLTQEEFIQDQIIVLATERALHSSMEAILDVGNHIIDGFIMRDPGSYTDIIEILRDEKVLPEESAQQFKDFITFRKDLVNEYTTTVPEVVYDVFVRYFTLLTTFENHVQAYLHKELE